MADLRLKGAALTTVRRLATGSFTGSALWSVLNRDFKVPELMALPASQRRPLQETPCPQGGAPPRQWEDEQHAPPMPSPNSAAALVDAYRTGRTDPLAVLRRLQDRMAHADFGPATHSPYVAVDAHGAREAAEAAAQRYREGRPLGPLDGVPVAIKDEVHVRGLPTRGGTAYLGHEADEDGWAVARLRATGAVLVGKTHCPEWGLNPLGFNEHFSMPRNAWSNGHGAGGSSTGTAVAVALGLASLGLASDGGGSIRIPSSLNGVFGLKPTWQRVGRSGDIWGSGSMPHVGPIGSSTADCVAFLAATAARDPGDPATWLQSDLPAAVDGWWRALGRGVKGCRIGLVQAEWAECPAEIAGPAMAALKALEKEGARLVDVELPLAPLCPGIGALSIGPETSANIDDDLRRFPDRFTDEIRIIAAFMGLLTARERLLVQRTRAELRHQTARAMAGCDLLGLPTLQMGAAPYPLSEDRVGVMDSGATAKTTRYAFLANLTGLPAASVPVGLCDGRPVGLQLVGDAWDEASVIAAMAHLERIGVTHIGHSPGWRSLAG